MSGFLTSPASAANSPSYMISIPELPTITSSGWNSFGTGISVKTVEGSTFSEDLQLVVSVDSSNDWNLVNIDDNTASIDYYLAASATDTEAATMFTFSAASMDEGASQDLGAIVDDITNKPGGYYEDSLTFIVEIGYAPVTEYTAKDGDTFTGTAKDGTLYAIASDNSKTMLASDIHLTVAAGATITLQSADITSISNSWAGITCNGDATIILEGTNAVKGGSSYYPGIHIAQNATLTINGEGSLTASGNNFGAGIGSGFDMACGNIVIEGGTIIATGGDSAAGIGSNIASCGTITITSGVTSVTATAGGGSWTTTKHSIGAGNNGSCGTVTIDGTVTGEITASPYTYITTNTRAFTLTDGMTLFGTGGSSTHITVAAGATITLKDATITSIPNNDSHTWAGITCAGDATIILEGTNAVKGGSSYYPGIHIAQNATLTINGEGSLTASGNNFGAGIGSGFDMACGNIVIEGGTITATGGQYAAGIGSSNIASCGTITITDGVTSVTATKGNGASISIGAGYEGSSCDTVTIGGTVYWDGSDYQNGGDSYLTQSTLTYTPGS